MKPEMNLNTKRPEKGEKMTVRGVSCTITKVWKFGTVDVVSDCGKYAWRVTGLPFI